MLSLLTSRGPKEHQPRVVQSAPRTGWVGIDVGSRAVKYARVACERGQWRLVEAHILPLAASQSLNDESISQGLIRTTLADLPRPLSRKSVHSAGTVSMGVTELRSMGFPQATDDELRQMVASEFAANLGETECEFSFWRMPRNEGRADSTQVTALALRRSTALGVANDLAASGLRCRLLTTMPHALARAVALADPASGHEPVAAFDWGYTMPSLTIVQNGMPIFTRTLRDCGASRVSASLAQQLGLTADECWQLIESLGAHATRREGNDRIPSAMDHISELCSAAIRQALQQLERTRAFLKQQYPQLMPRRAWVFGCGAMLRHSFPAISQALGAETRPWRLPTSDVLDDSEADSMLAVLGPAIGMSSFGLTP